MMDTYYNKSIVLCRLLEAIESVADYIPLQNTSMPVIIARSQFAVSAQEIDIDMFEQVFSVNIRNDSNATSIDSSSLYFMRSNESTASILLPNNVLNSVGTGSKVRISNAVYLDDTVFLRRNNNDIEVGSIIMSASINSSNNKSTFDPPVMLTFRRSKVMTTIKRYKIATFL